MINVLQILHILKKLITPVTKETQEASKYCVQMLDYCKIVSDAVSGTTGIKPLLVDPTQVESKKSSQIQWPVPSINAELVEVFLEGE